MLRLFLKLLWKALPILLIAIVGWWLFNRIATPAESVLPATPSAHIIDKGGVIEAISHVNKQVFVDYYIVKDIDYTQTPSNWTASLGLKQSFVLLLKGNVPAGFDMAKVGEDDIWVSRDGTEVQLTLPSPEVFDEMVTLDLENSRILAQSDSCPDFLCDDASKMLLNDSLPEGKMMIANDAREGGILTQAAKDGKLYYQTLLQSLGFEKVKVIVTGYDAK